MYLAIKLGFPLSRMTQISELVLSNSSIIRVFASKKIPKDLYYPITKQVG